MPTQKQIDRHHVEAAAVLCAMAAAGLWPSLHLLGLVAVVLTDGLIIALILTAAAYSNARGAPEARRFPYLPSRSAALAVLPLLATAAVIGFAAIYRLTGEVHGASSTFDAVYFSTVTITTVGYGDMHPNGPLARLAAMAEIATGALFLIGAFPLLIARLINFEDVSRWQSAPPPRPPSRNARPHGRTAQAGQPDSRLHGMEEDVTLAPIRHATRGKPMSHVTYKVIRHDDGWAYSAEGTISETFPSHAAALAAAQRACREQRAPGRTMYIEYEDDKGEWHTELASGHDRPVTDVED